MKQRGRKSAESLSLNVIEGDFTGKRPEPPVGMTIRQSQIWSEIVADEPLDCFGTATTRAMLKNMCIHLAMAESLTETINEIPETFKKNRDGLKHLRDLLKSRDIETRAAANLATKLRLTNQSRYTPHGAAKASDNTQKGLKIWDWEQ